MNVKKLFFIFVCFLQTLFIANNCNGVSGSILTASTNVTTVQVGHPFTQKCQVSENVLENEPLEIYMDFNISTYFTRYVKPGTI